MIVKLVKEEMIDHNAHTPTVRPTSERTRVKKAGKFIQDHLVKGLAHLEQVAMVPRKGAQ